MDGLDVYKDTDDEDDIDDVKLSNWDESNNPTPELKVKLMLWKRKLLWKTNIQPVFKR